ncbi:MAG TPA: hypothetical protein VKZ65_05550 [Glycomyces sp.]|nr:hypothetical protein [Glycomyces sp.]
MKQRTVRALTAALLAAAGALAFALTGSFAQASATEGPSEDGYIAGGDSYCC